MDNITDPVTKAERKLAGLYVLCGSDGSEFDYRCPRIFNTVSRELSDTCKRKQDAENNYMSKIFTRVS